MRFLHTADWHIGKIVNGHSMILDQENYLNQLVDRAKTLDLDAFVMAGDLYDRSMPSKEAVALANRILTRLVEELDIPILMIAGNHDSSERISYGADIFVGSGLHMAGVTREQSTKVSTQWADFHLIPFADHYTVRSVLGMEDSIKSIEDATKEQVKRITGASDFDPSRLNILLFHGYVISKTPESVEVSDSERALSIGTVEYVDQSLFKAFDYVALGHLHQAQKVGSEHVRYSGSILKYSKSEVHHKKKSLLVDIDKDYLSVEDIIIPVDHDMRRLKGSFEDLMKEPASEDYLFFELEDKFAIQDAMAQLKQKFPNAMNVSAPYLNANYKTSEVTYDREEFQKKSLADLFQLFYAHYVEDDLDKEDLGIIETVARESRADQ